MSETQVYGVVLPVLLARKARVIAAMEGKSRSMLMRELLVNYLANTDVKVMNVTGQISRNVQNKEENNEQ